MTSWKEGSAVGSIPHTLSISSGPRQHLLTKKQNNNTQKRGTGVLSWSIGPHETRFVRTNVTSFTSLDRSPPRRSKTCLRSWRLENTKAAGGLEISWPHAVATWRRSSLGILQILQAKKQKDLVSQLTGVFIGLSNHC